LTRRRLVGWNRLTRDALGGATGDRGKPVRVTLEQRDPTPVLQAAKQLGEVEAVPGRGERALVRGVEHRPVFREECVPDGCRGRAGPQRITGSRLIVE